MIPLQFIQERLLKYYSIFKKKKTPFDMSKGLCYTNIHCKDVNEMRFQNGRKLRLLNKIKHQPKHQNKSSIRKYWINFDR